MGGYRKHFSMQAPFPLAALTSFRQYVALTSAESRVWVNGCTFTECAPNNGILQETSLVHVLEAAVGGCGI